MTIERLSFTRGVPFELDRIKEVVKNNADKLMTLAPGDYDLTPHLLRDHYVAQTLVVNPDGTGVILPTRGEFKIVLGENEQRPLNADWEGPWTLVAPSPDGKKPYLYEWVAYHKGRSPEITVSAIEYIQMRGGFI